MSDDSVRGFQVEPVPQGSFLARLLGRAPREAAFVEIRNRLATTPFDEILEADITDVLARSKMVCRDATAELTDIYARAAVLVATDGEITDNDRNGLSNLQRAFGLTDSEARCALESAISAVFERVMAEALAGGTFTDETKAKVENTAKALGMSEAQTKSGFRTAAKGALSKAFSAAVADRRYSVSEEAEIEKLAKALGAEIGFDDATSLLVARYRLLSQIDDGNVPTIEVPVLLQRGEVCHFSNVASLQEIKTITKRVNYSGPTASIKLLMGVRWRLGSIAVQKVTKDVLTQVDSGSLYLTNKRLFFDGLTKNISIPLGKIT